MMKPRTLQHHRRPSRRAGFSLIEVLMSIFILGIGIISIAALFPAGIKQQQQSTDDILGPKVAKAAMSIIRNKVSSGDFGGFDEWVPAGAPAGAILLAPQPTVSGDWGWLRPSFLWTDDSDSLYLNERGAIDIFSAYWHAAAIGHPEFSTSLSRNRDMATEFPGGYTDLNGLYQSDLFGIPYDRPNTGAGPGFGAAVTGPKRAIITQQERYYPQGTQLSVALSGSAGQIERDQPQYVWDCMFRRFQGRVQVAIFVYRVSRSGGENEPYYVQPNPQLGTQTPPIPYHLSFWDPVNGEPINLDVNPDGPWDDTGPNEPRGWAGGAGNRDTGFGGGANEGFVGGDDRFVWGRVANDAEDLFNERQAWQRPRQWLLDQSARTHRVLSREADPDDADIYRVELERPVPRLPDVRTSGFSSSPYYFPFLVSDIWYIPPAPRTDDGTFGSTTFTPVYVLVEDL